MPGTFFAMPSTQGFTKFLSDAKRRFQASRWMPVAFAVLAVALLAAAVVLVVIPRLSGSSTPPSGEASAESLGTAQRPPPTAAPACGEAVVNTLSTRDKLAQLSDGRRHRRRRRPRRRGRPTRRRHHDRQLDRPVDAAGRVPARDRRFVRSAAPGGQRRRRGRPGTTPVEHHRLTAATANTCRECLAGRGVHHRPPAWPRDERPWNHSRFRACRRRHRCAGRHRHRRPVVRLEPGNRDHLSPANTRGGCATPACCRCSNTSPGTATARAIRTPAG